VAGSRRNDALRQLAPKVEQELAGCEEDSIIESGPVLGTLNLGHACLRNECWSPVGGMGLGGFRSEYAAPQFATPRLRGPRGRRARLHHSRPPHRAEARFTPDNREFLTF
jgi:hypothetical protein